MKNPILSICIPTYNRGEYIETCIKSITDQLPNIDNPEDIEIVISDNASVDNTEKIVKKCQLNFSNIKYYRNNENIGFDRNVLNVIESATGEYCLTIGDDDGLLDGALKTIVEKIENYNSPYYLLKNIEYDRELKHPRISNQEIIPEDKKYYTLDNYLKELSGELSLVGTFGGMSTHLFRRLDWIQLSRKEDFIGDNVIHLYVILSAFKGKSFVKIGEPCIMTRSENLRWESFPGLQTAAKRTKATLKTYLWINRKFNLGESPIKIKIKLYINQYIIFAKSIVKKILRIIKLRK